MPLPSESDSDSICYLSDQVDEETEYALYSAIHHDSGASLLQQDMFDQVCVFQPADNRDSTRNYSQDLQKFVSCESDDSTNSVQVLQEESLDSLRSEDIIKISDSDDVHIIENVKDTARKRANNSHNIVVIASDTSDCLDSDLDDDGLKRLAPKKPVTDARRIHNTTLIVSDSSDEDSIFKNIDTLNEHVTDNVAIHVDKDAHREFNDSDWSLDEVQQTMNKNASWDICHKDRYSAPAKRQKRFFNLQCDNCKENGHISRDCSVPKKRICHLCGSEGHISVKCPDVICNNCHRPGHVQRKCTERRSFSFGSECRRCHMKGHLQTDCPDLWRRFHMTLTVGKIVRGDTRFRPRTEAYCYNCGKQGHYGHTCSYRRFHANLPVLPFIVSYRPPDKNSEKRQNDSEHSIATNKKAARDNRGERQGRSTSRIVAQSASYYHHGDRHASFEAKHNAEAFLRTPVTDKRQRKQDLPLRKQVKKSCLKLVSKVIRKDKKNKNQVSHVDHASERSSRNRHRAESKGYKTKDTNLFVKSHRRKSAKVESPAKLKVMKECRSIIEDNYKKFFNKRSTKKKKLALKDKLSEQKSARGFRFR